MSTKLDWNYHLEKYHAFLKSRANKSKSKNHAGIKRTVLLTFNDLKKHYNEKVFKKLYERVIDYDYQPFHEKRDTAIGNFFYMLTTNIEEVKTNSLDDIIDYIGKEMKYTYNEIYDIYKAYYKCMIEMFGKYHDKYRETDSNYSSNSQSKSQSNYGKHRNKTHRKKSLKNSTKNSTKKN